LEQNEYAETVIEHLHRKTFREGLEWQRRDSSVSAQPTPAITVSIHFYDDGPNSALWDYVYMSYPVGKDAAMLWNPASKRARLAPTLASGKTLVQLDEIVRHTLLEPRRKEFEAAMKELQG
jgi:hypothetical protein